MTSREEFETWYQREVSGCNGEFIAKDDAGEYLEVYTFLAWKTWQAARATAPAWHDAPTVPGDWVAAVDGFNSELQTGVTQDEIGHPSSWPGRWFGPIPKDES